MLLRAVTPGYLSAAGIPLVRGRWFRNDDRRDAEPVAVLNRAAADRWFPDSEPVGTRIRLDSSWGFDDEPVRTIVGVIGDVRRQGPTREPEPAVYVPNAQYGVNSIYATLHLAPASDGAPRRASSPRRAPPRPAEPPHATTVCHRARASAHRPRSWPPSPSRPPPPPTRRLL